MGGKKPLTQQTPKVRLLNKRLLFFLNKVPGGVEEKAFFSTLQNRRILSLPFTLTPLSPVLTSLLFSPKYMKMYANENQH